MMRIENMEMAAENLKYDEGQEIPEDLLEQVNTKSHWESGEAEAIHRPVIPYYKMVWMRLRKDKLAMFGIVVIVCMLLAAVFGPCSSFAES